MQEVARLTANVAVVQAQMEIPTGEIRNVLLWDPAQKAWVATAPTITLGQVVAAFASGKNTHATRNEKLRMDCTFYRPDGGVLVALTGIEQITGPLQENNWQFPGPGQGYTTDQVGTWTVTFVLYAEIAP